MLISDLSVTVKMRKGQPVSTPYRAHGGWDAARAVTTQRTGEDSIHPHHCRLLQSQRGMTVTDGGSGVQAAQL